jgi:hypothetical protein
MSKIIEASLKTRNAAGEKKTVYVYFSLQREPKWISTEVKVPADQLNDQLFVKATYPDAAELNRKILQLLDDTNKTLAGLPPKATLLDFDRLANPYKHVNVPIPVVRSLSLLDVMDRLIEDSKSGKRRKDNGGVLSKNIIKKYETTKDFLEDFENKYSFDLTDWQKISIDFYTQFMDYLYKVKGNSDETAGKRIQNVAAGINYVDGTIFNLPHRIRTDKWLVYENKEKEKILLYPDELSLLYHMPLQNVKEHLQKAKDLFFFSFYTFIRVGALFEIREKDIKKERKDMYRLTIEEKNDQTVTHELEHECVEIIERWKGKLPAGYIIPNNWSVDKYRKNLKKLIRLFLEYAKKLDQQGYIDDNDLTFRRKILGSQTLKRRYNGNIKKIESNFADKFTPHASRKSAINAMVDKGKDTELVAKKSGHSKDSEALKEYYEVHEVRMNKEINATMRTVIKQLIPPNVALMVSEEDE